MGGKVMLRAAYGLLWARWQETRWKIIGGVPMLSVAPLIFYHVVIRAALGPIGQPFDNDNIPAFASLFLMLMLAIGTISISVHSAGFGRKQEFGFPRHALRLPISTALLVACPMGYAWVTAVVVYMGSAFALSHLTGVALPLWPMALFLATMTTGMHAADWSLRGDDKRFCGHAFVIIALSAWMFLGHGDLEQVAARAFAGWFRALDYAFLATCCLAAFVAAVYGVGRQRRGVAATRFRLERVLELLADRIVKQRAAFGSPELALFWGEMKRWGALICIGNLAAIAAMYLMTFVFGLFAEVENELVVLWALYAAFFPVAAAAMVLAGFSGIDLHQGGLRLSPFEATRPVKTDTLVRIKLNVLGMALALSWPLVVPAALSWNAIWGETYQVQALLEGLAGNSVWSALLSIAVILAAYWTIIGLLLSLAYSVPYWGSSKSWQLDWAAYAALVIAALAIWDAMRGWQLGMFWSVTGYLLAAGLVCGTVAALYRASARGFLSIRGLALAIALWSPLAIAGIVWLYNATELDFVWGVLVAAALFLPLAPLGTAPLAMARLRHNG
jgi:hypothetical protein